LRLIANQVDLNPFGWSSITIRRLTDPGDRSRSSRTLARMTVDPKYARCGNSLRAILLGLVLRCS